MLEGCASMTRETATTVSGQLDTGHYFYGRLNEGTAEMTVSDCEQVVARYRQKTAATLDRVVEGWLDTFLATLEARGASRLSADDRPVAGRLVDSGQALFARLRDDELSLLISEGGMLSLSGGEEETSAVFSQVIEGGQSSFEVLALWVKAYRSA